MYYGSVVKFTNLINGKELLIDNVTKFTKSYLEKLRFIAHDVCVNPVRYDTRTNSFIFLVYSRYLDEMIKLVRITNNDTLDVGIFINNSKLQTMKWMCSIHLSHAPIFKDFDILDNKEQYVVFMEDKNGQRSFYGVAEDGSTCNHFNAEIGKTDNLSSHCFVAHHSSVSFITHNGQLFHNFCCINGYPSDDDILVVGNENESLKIDGPISKARFQHITAIAKKRFKDDSIVLADSRFIRKVSRSGDVETLFEITTGGEIHIESVVVLPKTYNIILSANIETDSLLPYCCVYHIIPQKGAQLIITGQDWNIDRVLSPPENPMLRYGSDVYIGDVIERMYVQGDTLHIIEMSREWYIRQFELVSTYRHNVHCHYTKDMRDLVFTFIAIAELYKDNILRHIPLEVLEMIFSYVLDPW